MSIHFEMNQKTDIFAGLTLVANRKKLEGVLVSHSKLIFVNHPNDDDDDDDDDVQ